VKLPGSRRFPEHRVTTDEAAAMTDVHFANFVGEIAADHKALVNKEFVAGLDGGDGIN
jgi:hypothetical protein